MQYSLGKVKMENRYQNTEKEAKIVIMENNYTFFYALNNLSSKIFMNLDWQRVP